MNNNANLIEKELKELYTRLANKVIEMGGVITETCLCTYKTTIVFLI